jgi:plastocyanin
MRKTLTTAALAALFPALLVAGCGSSNAAKGSNTADSSASSSAGASASPVVNVTVQGDKVTPNGDRVTAKVGQPVTLHVTSDRAGELHVHSSPEQELKYQAGKTTLKVTINTPGVIDIEDHVADVVVVQLQVS